MLHYKRAVGSYDRPVFPGSLFWKALSQSSLLLPSILYRVNYLSFETVFSVVHVVIKPGRN